MAFILSVGVGGVGSRMPGPWVVKRGSAWQPAARGGAPPTSPGAVCGMSRGQWAAGSGPASTWALWGSAPLP